MTLEAAVQCTLAGMPKRRMADVVNQRKRLRQIFVQTKGGGRPAGDLRDFNRVGQTVAEVVGITAREDLGLGFETAKSAGMKIGRASCRERVCLLV